MWKTTRMSYFRSRSPAASPDRVQEKGGSEAHLLPPLGTVVQIMIILIPLKARNK